MWKLLFLFLTLCMCSQLFILPWSPFSKGLLDWNPVLDFKPFLRCWDTLWWSCWRFSFCFGSWRNIFVSICWICWRLCWKRISNPFKGNSCFPFSWSWILIWSTMVCWESELRGFRGDDTVLVDFLILLVVLFIIGMDFTFQFEWLNTRQQP